MSFSKRTITRVVTGSVLVILSLYVYNIVQKAPKNFPVGKNFTVEEGETLKSISERLENQEYIQSAIWFRAGVSFLGRDRHVQLGGYVFTSPVPLMGVVQKLVFGKPDVPLIRVTIPEGSTIDEIGIVFQKELPSFSLKVFKEKVTDLHLQGKLFPSTYFLLPSTTEEKAIKLMTETFEEKYKQRFEKEFIPQGLSNEEGVINLAAILEGEAKEEADMRIVAGILIKRLKTNMPLQVDAAPETYTKRGLPSLPINNPGLVALDAVFHAQASPFLYYITGKDGTMHYAKTFAEHKENIRKYLR